MKVSGRLKHMGESQMGDKKRQAGKRYFTSELFYHGMILPGMIFVLLFNFVPMFGIVMAFQDYKPAKGFFGSAFVGMKHFKYLLYICLISCHGLFWRLQLKVCLGWMAL